MTSHPAHPAIPSSAARGPARTEPVAVAVYGRVRTAFSSDAGTYGDGVVLVGNGQVAAVGPRSDVEVPAGARVLRGGPDATVCPGLVDAHVHLAFARPEDLLRRGVVGMRDLGAPPERALGWRRPEAPTVVVAGPLLTAPGGYPSQTWGRDGFARGIDGVADARQAVADLVVLGVDVVKLALEPAGGARVPSLDEARAVVAAAHEHGLGVTCHALTAAMVERALDADVDELCHCPVEPLPSAVVARVADGKIPVVSTLTTHALADEASASTVLANAAALVAAGASLVYGTDLGNAHTRPGADSRELTLLDAAGLGRLRALRAATVGAGSAVGLAGRVPWRIAVGERAAFVLLDDDPVANLAAVDRPSAVVAGRGAETLVVTAS